MGSNLKITESIEKYIEEFSQSLHPVQKEIISYNESLGEIKKMQIAVSQCYFLKLITKMNYKTFEKNNETYFKYVPKKQFKKKYHFKNQNKNSPFDVLKKINFN